MCSGGVWLVCNVHTQRIRSTVLMSTKGEEPSFNIGQPFALDVKGGEKLGVSRLFGDLGMIGDLREKLSISTDVFTSIYGWWWPNTKVVAIKFKGKDCWHYEKCVVLDGNLINKNVNMMSIHASTDVTERLDKGISV